MKHEQHFDLEPGQLAGHIGSFTPPDDADDPFA
jgi:hypothetical protein